MRHRPFLSGRPSSPRAGSAWRGRTAWGLGLAVAFTSASSVAAAQGSTVTTRELDGTAVLRSPAEVAIARDLTLGAPLRLTDYYPFGHLAVPGRAPSGLRLSGGLYGPQRPFTLFESQVDASPSQAYLGLGYSRAWSRSTLGSGFSINADLGVTSPSANNGARLRGLLNGSQGLDDTMRDLRWSPVMAVNVKYSF